MVSDDKPVPAVFTINLPEGRREVNIYTREGFEILSNLWVRSSWQQRISYEPTWLGFPVIQLPEDLLIMQELIYKVRPDVLIETGTAHGGSAIFYASLFELLGRGRVITVDIEVRQPNRVAIQSNPLSKRISIVEGSSIAPETLGKIQSQIKPGERVMVVLDSDHTHAHVAAELQLYAPVVSPDSYVVVFDGVMQNLADAPGGKLDWVENNPLSAVREFLQQNREFGDDPYYNRMRVTHAPGGFLRRYAT